MWVIVGYGIIIFSVFGGFAMAGGHLAGLFQPIELLIIFGAAAGALVIGSGIDVTKKTLGAIGGLFKPSKVDATLQKDVLGLLFELLTKARRDGMLAVESDVERPTESALFQKYPAVLGMKDVVDFVVDYMRGMVSGTVEPFDMEAQMDAEIETHQAEGEHPIHAVTKMADGMPGFGIVAAVMGVVHTMESLGEPPEILGMMIAKALVGTFLGILLAYGFVAPLAALMESRLAERMRVFFCVKAVLLASVRGGTPLNAVEAGRRTFFPEHRPSFAEMEEHVKGLRGEPAAMRMAA